MTPTINVEQMKSLKARLEKNIARVRLNLNELENQLAGCNQIIEQNTEKKSARRTNLATDTTPETAG